LTREDWEFVLKYECHEDHDGQRFFWHYPGEIHIIVKNCVRAVRCQYCYAELTNLVCCRVTGGKERRAFVPWESIAYIDFVDVEGE
jgi:hypothetical protein